MLSNKEKIYYHYYYMIRYILYGNEFQDCLKSNLLDYKSPYTIDGNDESTLKNKLGITDQEELNTVERMMTSFKLAKMYTQTGAETFDTEHLLSIHKYLFDDIYPFLDHNLLIYYTFS